MKEYLLFDLDGTLTDPKLGICTCVQYALEAFGINEPDLDKLEPFIGPPLKESFMQFYQFGEEQAEAAVEKYRERFREVGLYENEIYPGIAGMLRTLKKNGMHLAVASSKPTVFVEKILEYFKIKQYFEVVVGSELDGRRVNKDEGVQEALRQLFPDKPIAYDKIYMIGDRKFDVEGAKAQGVEAVGVAYGYGGVEELKEAQADYIVRSVAELEHFLLREFEAGRPKSVLQTVKEFAVPFLIFVLVQNFVNGLLVLFFNKLGLLTANRELFLYALSFLFAGAAIWKPAKRKMDWSLADMYLTHLRPEPSKVYVLLAIGTVGSIIGVNVLLEMLGVTGNAINSWTSSLLAPNLWVLLLCGGVLIPIAEEILFQGILFHVLRRHIKIYPAMFLVALCYAFYNGSLVGFWEAFLICCLAAYAYAYFGSFLMAVLVHILSRIVGYLISYASIAGGSLYNWGWGIFFLLIGAVCFGILWKRKKVL